MKDFKSYVAEGVEADIIGLLKSFGAGDIETTEEYLSTRLRKKQQVWDIVSHLPAWADYDVFVYSTDAVSGEVELENPGGIDNGDEPVNPDAEDGDDDKKYTIDEIGYEDLTDQFHDYELVVYLYNAVVTSDGHGEEDMTNYEESFCIEEVTLMEAKTAKEIGTHLISKFGNDPLYSDVITAILGKDKAGAQKAMKTLGSIRGPQAVKNLQAAYKSFVSENVDMLDERRRVIKVNARGQRRIKIQCKRGYRSTNGRCIKISGSEMVTKKRAIKRSVRTKKAKGAGFQRRVSRLRKRAVKKRRSMGLNTGFDIVAKMPRGHSPVNASAEHDGNPINEARQSKAQKKAAWMRVYQQEANNRKDKTMASQIDWNLATHLFFTGADAKIAAQTSSTPFVE